MQPPSEPPVGSQAAFRPLAANTAFARGMHPPAPTAFRKLARDGFTPDGRKKLTSADDTQGNPCSGPGFKFTPQGPSGPDPKVNGPIGFGGLLGTAPAASAML